MDEIFNLINIVFKKISAMISDLLPLISLGDMLKMLYFLFFMIGIFILVKKRKWKGTKSE